MKLKCIIVDDDKFFRKTFETLISRTDSLELVRSCATAMEAYDVLQSASWRIDLIFLDIVMPEMSGLELIKKLEIKPVIILITSKPEYALESYDYDITDFIVKPVKQAQFLKAVEKARKACESKPTASQQKQLFVRINDMLEKINTKNILCVKASHNNVFTKTSSNEFKVHTTMSAIEDKLLSTGDFLRVHRSYIVRVDKIDKIQGDIITIDKKLISVGISYRDELIRKLNIL